jgi:hypothetical protein
LKNIITEKLKESFTSIIPITLIVLVVCIVCNDINLMGLIPAFLIGCLLLVFGMSFFDIGVNISMIQIGSKIGKSLTKRNNVYILLLMCFIIATIITIAEPDLLVLANQTPNISPLILIFSVGFGVGLFFLLGCIRLLRKWNYNILLIVICFFMLLISFFAPKEFIGVAFDSGGVTTGALSVPFIMSLSRGLSGFRTDKNKKEDTFGLMAFCSLGPIIIVLLLGILYHPESTYEKIELITNSSLTEVIKTYISSFPIYIKDVLISFSPIIVLFFIYNFAVLKLNKNLLFKIIKGLIYTFIGLTLFLTGVNIGLLPMAYLIGQTVTNNVYILIPLTIVLGFFIIYSEPALKVLLDQIDDITNGTINKKILLLSISIGVSIATCLAIVRIIVDINLLYIIVPGYIIAILLSFFTPNVFTRIAFDSGGVASGTMTASFLLPFAIGSSELLGKNVLVSAFGLVAIVATIPLITVEIIGIVYKIKTRKQIKEQLFYAEIIDY